MPAWGLAKTRKLAKPHALGRRCECAETHFRLRGWDSLPTSHLIIKQDPCQLNSLFRAYHLLCRNHIFTNKLCKLKASSDLALSLSFDFGADAQWMLLGQSAVAFCGKCLISLLSLMLSHTEFEKAERWEGIDGDGWGMQDKSNPSRGAATIGTSSGGVSSC